MHQKNTFDIHPFLIGDEDEILSPQTARKLCRQSMRGHDRDMYCMVLKNVPGLFTQDPS